MRALVPVLALTSVWWSAPALAANGILRIEAGGPGQSGTIVLTSLEAEEAQESSLRVCDEIEFGEETEAVLGDLVEFDIVDSAAANIQVIAPGTVFASDTTTDQVLFPNRSMLIQNGATLTGDVKNLGGSLVVTDAGSVDGTLRMNPGSMLCVTQGGEITGTTVSKDASNIFIRDGSTIADLKARNSGAVAIAGASTVNGNIKLTNSGDVQCDDFTASGSLILKNSGRVVILDGTIDRDVKVTNSGSIQVTGNTIGRRLQIRGSGTCTDSNNTVGSTVDGCP